MSRVFLMGVKVLSAAFISVCLLTSCTDDMELQTVNNSGSTPNRGIVSDKNFSILASDLSPNVFNAADGSFTSTAVTISARVGDRNNLVLTDSHTVLFKTDYGLLEPDSCVTENGSCSVQWIANKNPAGLASAADGRASITGYTDGEEGFDDANGNGLLDVGELFVDIGEPFINYDGSEDANKVPTFTLGDIPIDTVNADDPTGNNGSYDAGDNLFNGSGCTDTSRCSSQTSIKIHAQVRLTVTVTAYAVGGNVSGLPGGTTMTISLNGGVGLDITVNGNYSFPSTVPTGDSYNVTILSQPAGATCSVSNGNGVMGGTAVVNANITCT